MSAPDHPLPYTAAGPAALRFLEQQARRRRCADTAAGQVLYLMCTGAVVVPVRRMRKAWECVTITTGGKATAATESAALPVISDIEIETALPVRLVHPLHELEVVLRGELWLARVWHRFPGGPVPQLATALVQFQDRTTGTIRLTEEATARLVTRAHHTPPAIRAGLGMLTRAGLLTADPRNGERCEQYRLKIPPGLPVAVPARINEVVTL